MTQDDYLKQVKNIGCVGCHQLGQEATRTIPAAFGHEGSTEDAWIRRIQSGQAGASMANQMGNWNNVPLKYYAEWTDQHRGRRPASEAPAAGRCRAQYRGDAGGSGRSRTNICTT